MYLEIQQRRKHEYDSRGEKAEVLYHQEVHERQDYRDDELHRLEAREHLIRAALHAEFARIDYHLNKIERCKGEEQGDGKHRVGLALLRQLIAVSVEERAHGVHEHDNAYIGFLHFQGTIPPINL